MEDDARTLSQVIGAQAAELRRRAGRRQEDVAVVARGMGLPWKQATVAAIETGKRELSVEELVIIPSILQAAFWPTVGFVKLHDLIPDDARIALSGESMAVSGSFVKQTLTGTLEWAIVEPQVEDALGEAEYKAARNLRLRPEHLAAAAKAKWGHSLTAERDRRLGSSIRGDESPRSVQARRGHITRALLDELREELGTED